MGKVAIVHWQRHGDPGGLAGGPQTPSNKSKLDACAPAAVGLGALPFSVVSKLLSHCEAAATAVPAGATGSLEVS